MPRAEAPVDPGGGAEGLATRARIVDAATSMFLARGFDAVPMSQVAEAAGVTTPALYWHFKSKSDLYFEVLETEYRTFFEELVAQTVGDSARQRLHSYVRRFVEMQLRDRDFAMVFGVGQLQAWLSREQQEEFKALQRPYGEFLKNILQQGRDAGELTIEDVSITALAIHTMCEYAVVWYKPNHRLTAAEIASLYADLVLRMSAAPRPAAASQLSAG